MGDGGTPGPGKGRKWPHQQCSSRRGFSRCGDRADLIWCMDPEVCADLQADFRGALCRSALCAHFPASLSTAALSKAAWTLPVRECKPGSSGVDCMLKCLWFSSDQSHVRVRFPAHPPQARYDSAPALSLERQGFPLPWYRRHRMHGVHATWRWARQAHRWQATRGPCMLMLVWANACTGVVTPESAIPRGLQGLSSNMVLVEAVRSPSTIALHSSRNV